MSVIFVDCFTSGIDEMKRKDQRDPVKVLLVLQKTKEFSVFEATQNNVIAKTITNLLQRGYIKDVGGGYPWTKVEITPAGQALIDAEEKA